MSKDLEAIKLISDSKMKGGKAVRQCKPFDFFTLSFNGYIQDGDKLRQVLDSKVTNNGKPTTFQ